MNEWVNEDSVDHVTPSKQGKAQSAQPRSLHLTSRARLKLGDVEHESARLLTISGGLPSSRFWAGNTSNPDVRPVDSRVGRGVLPFAPLHLVEELGRKVLSE